MDEVLQPVLMVNLRHMAAHGHVTRIVWGRRQLPREITRNRMLLLLQVARNHIASPEL